MAAGERVAGGWWKNGGWWLVAGAWLLNLQFVFNPMSQEKLGTY
jgi:hypothetical protein